MQVRLIAITKYVGDQTSSADAESSERLIEHAGRTCYRSRMSEDADGIARFVQGRIAQGHESIIEHSSASFEISGISRACSHQLVRHRIASYSQESQRYVDMSHPEWVIPPSIAASAQASAIWDAFLVQAQSTYRQLRDLGIKKEDARFLLPNATATRLVMSANFRELLHMFRLRISPHAQWEIRELCVRMLKAVSVHAPNVFGSLREQLLAEHPEYFGNAGSPPR
jgi:thymidylate synthase (FAD)